MKTRLIRALQRGGIPASTGDDTWRVWRSQDRRGRVIGTLSGAEIDILRLRHDLKPLGKEEDQLLVWAGRQMERASLAAVAPELLPPAEAHVRSLLEMLIANCASAALRTRIRRACQAYIQDLEGADHGASTTMNWDGLARGRLAKGQRRASGFNPPSSAAAKRRLAKVSDQLADDERAFLEKLIVREASRSSIAKAFAMRPALAEQKGMSVLRQLVQIYGV